MIATTGETWTSEVECAAPRSTARAQSDRRPDGSDWWRWWEGLDAALDAYLAVSREAGVSPDAGVAAVWAHLERHSAPGRWEHQPAAASEQVALRARVMWRAITIAHAPRDAAALSEA